MDFNALPCELKEHIFGLLLPQDLYSCLGVCREWRRICNTERLWKKALKKTSIDFSDESTEDGIQDLSLCKLAFLWKQHSKTCSGWYSNSFKQELIPYETSEELTCCRIYVFKDKMALITNKIQFFSFSNNKSVKENISLPFDPHAVTMNSKYIVCQIGNILLIYKKEVMFKKYCAIALTENSVLAIQTEKLKAFIESQQRFGPYIKAEALVGEHLWISCLDGSYRHVNVINLKHLTVTDININARLFSITKHNIVISTQDRIQVLNFKGKIQYIIKPEPKFKSFRATDHFIVTFPNFGENYNIWTIDGKFLWKLEDTIYRFHLDPTRHMLYACSQMNDSCKLSAYDLKTGDLSWVADLPGINSSEIDDMFLVCDKFLIIDVYVNSPSPAFHFGFILDLDSKILLYKSVLKGFTMHVSNNLWVQKRQNDLIVNIY